MPHLYLSQSFKIHPVGQGLFYTCNISHSKGNTPFRFVFDCGSLNKKNAEDEVDHYLTENFPDQNEALDLLIVSHFDEDHINFIPRLLNNLKVKKIITPFISLEERLVLVLKAIAGKKRGKANQISGQTISNMLDPDSLIRYLGEGGELIVIESDPGDPPFNVEDEMNINTEKERISPNLTFDFPSRRGASKKHTVTTGIIKQSTVRDSNKGMITLDGIPVMEFLFYRKQVGSDDILFFKKVYELFLKNHSSEFVDPNAPTIDELVNTVKKVHSATEIKEIFRKAAGTVKGISLSISKLTDMNTTALCLLHHNPQSLFKGIHEEIKPLNLIVASSKFAKNVRNTESSPADFLIANNWIEQYDPKHPYNSWTMPNTMLTSDSFLLTSSDVAKFKNRYDKYWGKFWLFQLPHHGAERNSDLTLLKLIPNHVFGFINYGIEKTWGGTWRHPSPKLLENLMMTDLHLAFLKVNENIGLEFGLKVWHV